MIRSLTRGLSSIVLIAVASCNSAATSDAVPGSYALTNITGPLGLVPGTSSSVVVVVKRTGFSAAIGVTAVAVPSGVHVTLPVTPVTGDTVVVAIAVDNGTAAGTYQFQLHGSGEGAVDQDITVTVAVGELGNYSLLVAPRPVLVPAGGTAVATVIITRYPGFTGAVSLVVDPSLGITADVTPGPVTGDSAIITVHAPTSLLGNSVYAVRIRGIVPGTLDVAGGLLVQLQ